jgi:hypothetical protein
MSREFEFRRLPPESLDQALQDLGITSTELAELTGTRRPTVARWFREIGDPERLEPPFWLTQLLGLAALPGGVERLRAVASLHRIEKASHDRS